MSPPYNIEIVPVDRGWILETMARAIEREAAESPRNFNVRIVDEPSDRAELTFFLPESAYRPLRNSTTVTYLAHKEDHPSAAALFEEVARKSDYCITSSTKYQRILEQDGAKKVFKIHLGVDTELFIPKLRLGVVGRTYHTGRKGEALLAELAGMPMVEMRFTGEGWPQPAGYYETSDLVNFYNDIDYLLIPSLIEGGPVPLLEALSTGCPVIAPSDIGLVEDFPHVPYKRGDGSDLRRVVEMLLHEKLAIRESVAQKDWKNFARQHLDIFADLIDERRRTRTTVLESAKAENAVRALLVTHGTEDAAKGGPSTRVRLIVSQLRAEGHEVEARHNISAGSDLGNFDVVHVFNSWPPQTALDCMAIAKRGGKRVVFSPIALDLADWPIYRQLLESVFATGDRQVIESVVRQLPSLSPRRDYSKNCADVPFEGIPGHFEALRRCCALADHLIFLSDQERDFLAALGAKVDHGVLIHNGVADVFGENADPDLFRKRSGFNRYVLCVGRIEYRKNQALLALAMRDLEVPLVLIGDVGDPGYLDHVRLLGGGNVHHFSRIEDKALLASAYAGASAFVLPSWCEGAPLAALEAGLTGVPLILSDRSSEKEYFGDYADYIPPTDPTSMRAAISSALALQEPPERRVERAKFLRKRYSETEHARNTLALYRSAMSIDPAKAEGDLVVDMSSLLHSLRSGGHLTGVPLAERNLIAEIVDMHPATRCIVYNDFKGRFIEVPYRDLESFDGDTFNHRHWFSDDASTSLVDWRAEFTLMPPPNTLLPEAAVTPVRAGRWNYLAARVVGLLTRSGMSEKNIRRVGRVAKRLRSVQVKLMHRTKVPMQNTAVLPPKADVDFSDASRYIVTKSTPRLHLNFRPQSRILTLGQGWLSNEPLLERLIELSAGHSLEAYVYDISYVSGAHFSGWTDNEDRLRRLTKLLRHCRTAFTESRITASELAKFAASRSLRLRIVRTELRGKDVAAPQRSMLKRSQSPFILYVSSFNRRKNHDFIVSVWRDLMSSNSLSGKPNIRLLLVGEIQGEQKYGDPDFQNMLKRLNIDVITDADDDQISQYYRQCLFTVYPSLQEGWGIPIQESLMSGKLCIASNTVPAAVEIDSAAIVKLAPNDFFGWREAIVTWAINDTMRVAFASKASEYTPPGWREIAQSILNRRSIGEVVS